MDSWLSDTTDDILSPTNSLLFPLTHSHDIFLILCSKSFSDILTLLALSLNNRLVCWLSKYSVMALFSHYMSVTKRATMVVLYLTPKLQDGAVKD